MRLSGLPSRVFGLRSYAAPLIGRPGLQSMQGSVNPKALSGNRWRISMLGSGYVPSAFQLIKTGDEGFISEPWLPIH
jgi:hypothetical protein